MMLVVLMVCIEWIIFVVMSYVFYGLWYLLYFVKFIVMFDYILCGCWGINVVIGYCVIEYEMFGWNWIEYDWCYEMVVEFFDVVQQLWV